MTTEKKQRPQEAPEDDPDHDDDEENRNMAALAAARPALGTGCGEASRFAPPIACRYSQRPVVDAGVIIALLERRPHHLFDDDLRLRIGQNTFKAVADFDADLVFRRRDDDQRAVVLALLADAPGAAELIAVVLDRIALQRFERDDDDLVAGLLFLLGKQIGELRWVSCDKTPASSTTRRSAAEMSAPRQRDARDETKQRGRKDGHESRRATILSRAERGARLRIKT